MTDAMFSRNVTSERKNGKRNGPRLQCIRDRRMRCAALASLLMALFTLSLQASGQDAATIGAGKINTFAGQPPVSGGLSCPSGYGSDNVPLSLSCITAGASGTAMDSAGNLYFGYASSNNIHVIYSGSSEPALLKFRSDVSPQPGYLYRVAGSESDQQCYPNQDATCGDGGLALNATFNFNSTNASLAFDKAGNLFIADNGDNAIRKVDATTGIVSTVVGDTTHQYVGYGAYSSTAISLLYGPNSIGFDSSDNLYISDSNNFIISKVNLQSNAITTVAGTPLSAWSDLASNFPAPTGSPCAGGSCGDGGNATSAQLCYASAVFVNGTGDILIADCSTIRKVNSPSAQSSPGVINTVAGALTANGIFPAFCDTTATPTCNDGQQATSAYLAYPVFVYQDPNGNILIADNVANSLRVVDTSGVINAVVGQTGTTGAYSGDGGTANQALLNGPTSFAFDSGGNLYVADAGNGLIRRVTAPAALQQQTITFNPPTDVSYGDAPIDLDHFASATSGLAISYSVVSGPGQVTGSTLKITGAGTVAVRASQDGDGTTWAPATPVTKEIPVAQAALTVTASNLTLQEGSAIPATLSYTFSGFVPPDTQASVVTGVPALSVVDSRGVTLPAGTVPAAGTYSIKIAKNTLSAGPNYTLNLANGTLLVTAGQSQTVTIGHFTPPAVYGDPNSSFTFTATASSGLPVDVTFTGPVRTQQTTSGWSVTVVGAGQIVITVTQSGNPTYAPATATSSFIVNPAVLTVTASNAQVGYGSSLPAFTYTASGFVGGDNASVLSGTPAYSTTATTTSAPGQYPINLSQGTLFAQNYNFRFVSGTLTVTQASQQINNFAAPASVTFGSGIFPLYATASSGLPVQYAATGAVVINSDGASFSPTSGGPASITAMQSGNADYAPVSATITFTVGKGILEIHALDATRPYGADNPQFNYDFGPGNPAPPANLLSGAPALSTPATQDSPTGTYPIIPSVGTLASSVYDFNFQNGTLTITPPSTYALTVSPTSVTIPSGQSRQVTITLTPINNYMGSVTIGCGNLPAGVTCTASPAQLTPPVNSATGNAQAISGTLTISAGQAIASAIPESSRSETILAAGFLQLPAVIAGLLLVSRRRQMKRSSLLFNVFAVLAFVVSTAGLPACGGGGSQSSTVAAGTTQIQVTGTGTQSAGTGNVDNSVGLTVTIQ